MGSIGVEHLGALANWLDQNLPELGSGRPELAPLAGGTSNAVYRVTRSGLSAVLRQPIETGDRIIEREARVLRALSGSQVPHPKLLGFCDDQAVLGRKFLVMELVEGRDGPGIMAIANEFARPQARAFAEATIDAAIALANFDYRSAGLNDFGKPEGFLERQADRWLAMLEGYTQVKSHRQREIPGLTFVAGWLKTNVPQSSPAGLLHGDIGFSNSMFSAGDPPHVVALLDWETATIGDPLLDLARAVLPMNGAGRPKFATSLFDYSNFPTREELAGRYARGTGRSTVNLDYYVVLAQFKLAIILERHFSRAEIGEDPHGESRKLANYALELIARAEAIAKGQA